MSRSVRVERWAGLAVVFAIAVSAAVAGFEAIDRLINRQHVSHLWALAAAGGIGYARQLDRGADPHSGGRAAQQPGPGRGRQPRSR